MSLEKLADAYNRADAAAEELRKWQQRLKEAKAAKSEAWESRSDAINGLIAEIKEIFPEEVVGAAISTICDREPELKLARIAIGTAKEVRITLSVGSGGDTAGVLIIRRLGADCFEMNFQGNGESARRQVEKNLGAKLPYIGEMNLEER